MNRQEYYNSSNPRNKYYRRAHKLLKDWKIKNNIPTYEKCVVHHRDDNDAVRAYNESHYELWGFNEDGTFEYGKYVVFMLNADHTIYHRKGKPLSAETKEKISVANKGRKLSEEAKEHLSSINKGENHPMYGKKRSAETREKMSECKVGANNPMYGKPLSTETKEKLSVSLKTYLASLKFLYYAYKNNGGSKKWNDFKKALKTGDITFSDYKIPVMNNT